MFTELRGSVSVSMRWVEAMHNAADLSSVCGQLAQLVRAETLVIGRINWADHRQRRIGVGYLDDVSRLSCPVGQGRALEMFGRTLRTARENTVWSLSDLGNAGLARVAITGIAESFILCLQSKQETLDVLELHYQRPPSGSNLDLFRILSPELASAWRRRLPGAAARLLNPVRAEHADSDDTMEGVLHYDNPANLSRSEFRICMMFGEGRDIAVIAKELSISVPTVRSQVVSRRWWKFEGDVISG